MLTLKRLDKWTAIVHLSILKKTLTQHPNTTTTNHTTTPPQHNNPISPYVAHIPLGLILIGMATPKLSII